MLAAPAVAQTALPDCGEDNVRPYFTGAIAERSCDDAAVRTYRPRYSGVAYRVLDLESEACFVPDSAYATLDSIVADVISRVDAARPKALKPGRDLALLVSSITSETLRTRGFALHIPTRTLADALVTRASEDPNITHIFDCDTGSLILLTIAEHYALPAALVDLRLPSGKGHNYVRWDVGNAGYLDWDMNMRKECRTPSGQEPWLGRPMTADEVTTYILEIRGDTWERRGDIVRALSDRSAGMALAPSRPASFNGFAWLIATRQVPHRALYRDAALEAATRAVALRSSADYLDTLACVRAWRGEMTEAAVLEQQAVDKAPVEDKAAFETRRDRFDRKQTYVPYDCTGD